MPEINALIVMQPENISAKLLSQTERINASLVIQTESLYVDITTGNVLQDELEQQP